MPRGRGYGRGRVRRSFRRGRRRSFARRGHGARRLRIGYRM